MKYIAQRYNQGIQQYYSVVMDLKTVYDNSKVLIYNQDDYGYQRPLDEKHVKKIKNNIISGNGLFPTSIILSVNSNEVKEIISDVEFEDIAIKNVVSINLQGASKRDDYCYFRIVDGQHRLEGLAEAAKIKNELWDYKLSIIILVIPNESRVIELDVFNDINSTPKKLKTDLVILAKQKYILLGQKDIQSKEDMEEYLAIKIAHILNEEIKGSVWENAIKFEKEINSQIGIIGIAAYKKAILPLVKKIIHDEGGKVISIQNLDDKALDLADYFNQAWQKVYEKWESCFKVQSIIIESEKYDFYYDNSYYLQKTTGVNAVFQLLNQSENIEEFEKIINKSPLTEEDWLKGGKLSGLTSGSGFKKAVMFIKNGKTI
ncbi:DGQHR domain-containing protein [Paenalkalicoccus suaedae]|uniref:DGQHR domain-containing protein n=1 Tax=Paenalkalicoccus suaedae TaxID=2592382 RepID=A0A859FHM5_9BACI|nr:DGQHR domain-containing protein [Paenalkalicoccus suaedae]QKS72591.1 DGQHR domain-containing protein [Paenalkalicoccus suaedae]